MASPALNRIFDTAKVYLPGALDIALQLEFHQLLNDFFQMTNCWTEDIQIPVIPVTPATTTYLSDPLQFTYTLTPTIGAIVRMMWLVNVRDPEFQQRCQSLGILCSLMAHRPMIPTIAASP